jgi:hypothetical protein
MLPTCARLDLGAKLYSWLLFGSGGCPSRASIARLICFKNELALLPPKKRVSSIESPVRGTTASVLVELVLEVSASVPNGRSDCVDERFSCGDTTDSVERHLDSPDSDRRASAAGCEDIVDKGLIGDAGFVTLLCKANGRDNSGLLLRRSVCPVYIQPVSLLPRQGPQAYIANLFSRVMPP